MIQIPMILKTSILYLIYSVRKTEIPELDVFLCESRYDDLAKTLRKLKTGGIKVRFVRSRGLNV